MNAKTLITALAGLGFWALARGGVDLQFTDIAQGLPSVVQATHAGDGSGRVFLVDRNGVIRIVRDGVLLEEPFLDIRARVSTGSERGLLGLAFPPGLEPKDRFYVNYTDNDGDTVVSRFTILPNPDRANVNSEAVVLAFDQPFGNHNGGQLAFGPDGMLYISTGDGGGAGDPLESGQDLTTLLGKILRIDVSGGGAGYSVPPDNPFAGGKGGARPEIWAWGLRNPWRASFDQLTGDFYIADVGQDDWEEIDVQPADSPGGENYGWNIMEGSSCFLQPGCDQTGLTLPVYEYDHGQGDCSVTGGYVYRGSRYPDLYGMYLFGDFCSGRIWGLPAGGSARGKGAAVELADTGFQIAGFGEDELGNVYVADFAGGVYLISDGAPVNDTVAIGPRHSGSWYGGPPRDGEGFLLEVLPTGQLVVYWFTYDAEGNQVWVVGVGEIIGDTATIEAVITEGGLFGDLFDPDLVERTPWGTLTFVFHGCDSGTVTWDSPLEGFGSGSLPIERLTRLSALDC